MKLDYCNSLFLNIDITQINRLQAIRNALARAFTKTPKHHHITPVHKKLQWLKIPERIEYTSISLPYNTLQSSQPAYLRQLFTIQSFCSTRSSSALTLQAQSYYHLITKICQSLHNQWAWLFRLFGTNSRQHCDKYLTHPTNSPKPHLLQSLHSSFTPNWKHCSLANPIQFILFFISPSPPQLQTPSTIAIWLSACLTLWIWPDAYWFCFWQASVNKLFPATSLLWALCKSRVYDYDYIIVSLFHLRQIKLKHMFA